MTGVDIAIAWYEREAEETERYLKRCRNRTCGECANWIQCPGYCCTWGWCRNMDEVDDDGYVNRDTHAVRDYECMNFNERNDK